MIQQMRNNAAIIMWIVIVAFVATIVFAWGMDLSSRSRVKDSIGKVNGRDIALRYFDKMVSMERDKERERYNGAEVPQNENRMIPRQVWENEVSRILLRDVFSKMHFGASPDEIFEYIKRNPPPEVYSAKQFQTDSVFDTTKFIAFLNKPEVYENEGMQQLEKYTREFLVPAQSLRFLLSIQGTPMKAEVAYEYRTEQEKTVFEYAKLNIQALAADAVTDAQVSSYYQAHPDSFKTGEQTELYFIKIPKTATPTDEKVTYQDMIAMKAKINNSDSLFAEEARLESDDEATAVKGGDLGWVSKGSMVPQVDSVAFAIAPGVVSEPVKTKFGFHLIYVEKKETKDGKQVAKVRHILRKIVPTGETIDRLSSIADSVHSVVATEGAKAFCKKDSPYHADSTGLFGRGDAIPKIGYVAGAASFAFNREENDVSDLLENEDGYFIIQIKAKLKKGVLPLQYAHDRIARVISDSLRMEKGKAYFEAFLKKVPDRTAVARYSSVDSLFVSGVTDTVKRAQFVPQVGHNNTVVANAFALPAGTISNIIAVSGALFVVKPLWHGKVDQIPWETQPVMAIQQKMYGEEMEKNYYDWYLYQKSQAKIVDNLNQFYLD
jgi:parvulin-like peptidyl-prolyl isomerase